MVDMTNGGAVLALLVAGCLVGPAAAQAPSALVPPSAPAPSPVTRPQPVVQSKASAEAEAMRRAVDERLRKRDAAARRALQGICKGC